MILRNEDKIIRSWHINIFLLYLVIIEKFNVIEARTKKR